MHGERSILNYTSSGIPDYLVVERVLYDVLHKQGWWIRVRVRIVHSSYPRLKKCRTSGKPPAGRQKKYMIQAYPPKYFRMNIKRQPVVHTYIWLNRNCSAHVSMRGRVYGIAAAWYCCRMSRKESPASRSFCSSAFSTTPPPQPWLFLPLPLQPVTARPMPPLQTLPKRHRTTTRCPNKWLVCICYAYVSTCKKRCGFAAGYCYRPYQLTLCSCRRCCVIGKILLWW